MNWVSQQRETACMQASATSSSATSSSQLSFDSFGNWHSFKQWGCESGVGVSHVVANSCAKVVMSHLSANLCAYESQAPVSKCRIWLRIHVSALAVTAAVTVKNAGRSVARGCEFMCHCIMAGHWEVTGDTGRCRFMKF